MYRKPHILVIEDDVLTAKIIVKDVESYGCQVDCAYTGGDGINRAIESLPDIVLLDLILPDTTGYDVCRLLRNHAKTSNVQIIVLTARGEIDSKITAFKCGANDYVTKPYDVKELNERITACLRVQRVREDLDKLIHDQRETRGNLLKAEQLAITDPLTGLFNRRFFDDILSREFLRFHRYGIFFSFMMIDVDYFKKINDSISHQAGDKVLCELSEVIRSQVRDIDILSRWGGDEFGVILPHSSCDVAAPIANRILKAVSAHQFSPLAGGESLTVSIGVSGLPTENISKASQIVEAADQALMRAKKKGRQQVEVATDKDVPLIIPEA